MTNFRERTCARDGCSVVFHYKTDRKYCGDPCARLAHSHQKSDRRRRSLDKACDVCGGVFAPRNKQHVTCSQACRNTKHVQAATGKRDTSSTPPPRTTIPCASCIHGIPSLDSSIGYVCGPSLAMRCKPMGPEPQHYIPSTP